MHRGMMRAKVFLPPSLDHRSSVFICVHPWFHCFSVICDDQGRAAPSDALCVRPADRAFAARGAAAAGVAHAHADRELLAQGETGQALPQLAAGSLWQLGRAPGVPGQGARARDHRGPGRRHDGDQPVRFLRGSQRGEVSLRLQQREFQGARAVPGAGSADAAADGLGAEGTRSLPRQVHVDHRPADRRQSPGARGRGLPRADGARHPDAGRDAGARPGFVPRFGVAAGADPALPRHRRALRLGRDPKRTSPTCTRGPRRMSPAPDGSAWMRPRACSRAKATSRSHARRCREALRPSPA